MPIDLKTLEDTPHLLDILVQMEDVLDSLDIYVYRHWFDGDVIEGPTLGRHFASLTLSFPYKKMPDPRACLRLLKFGIKSDFDKVERERSKAKDASASGQVGAQQPQRSPEPVWMVKLSFPRRLLDQMTAKTLDLHDHEVDMDDVADAKDSGLDDESGFLTQEGGAASGMPGQAPAPGQDPMA